MFYFIIYILCMSSLYHKNCLYYNSWKMVNVLTLHRFFLHWFDYVLFEHYCYLILFKLFFSCMDEHVIIKIWDVSITSGTGVLEAPVPV